jgi:hypothetical protein
MHITLLESRTIEHRPYGAGQSLIVPGDIGAPLVADAKAEAVDEALGGCFVLHTPGELPAIDE